MRKSLADFRKLFFKRLDKKTGWGKEEVKKEFDDAFFESCTEVIE